MVCEGRMSCESKRGEFIESLLAGQVLELSEHFVHCLSDMQAQPPLVIHFRTRHTFTYMFRFRRQRLCFLPGRYTLQSKIVKDC